MLYKLGNFGLWEITVTHTVDVQGWVMLAVGRHHLSINALWHLGRKQAPGARKCFQHVAQPAAQKVIKINAGEVD